MRASKAKNEVSKQAASAAPKLTRRSSIAGLLLFGLTGPVAAATEADAQPGTEESGSLLNQRLERERRAQENRSVLLAHKRNYFLVTYSGNPNNDPIEDIFDDADDTLDHAEAHFQLSLKVQLAEQLFTENGGLYAGFTVRSFWQAFNSDISSPFRESNYEPELFWLSPVPWKVLGGDAALVGLGIVHQSNGRNQLFSRSWDRIYASLVWERWRNVFGLKVWYRIPEDDKDDPLDASGDDNPDIEDYMGNFEFTVAHRRDHHEYSVMLRNNLDSEDNRGAIQLDWTFPLHGRLRGYAQLFNGYGESLIDYDANITRVGIGFLLSDLL